MLQRLSGIVLAVVKHSDRHNVVTLFTRERGRVALLAPASGRGKGAVKSRLLPLAWIESEVNFKGNRELQNLSAVSTVRVWRTLYFDPVKSSLVMFMSEFLDRLLRTSAPDPATFDYITAFLSCLDTETRSVSNHHIAFLMGMLPFAGIMPTVPEHRELGEEGSEWFDMRSAAFSPLRPAHPDRLTPAEGALMLKLLRINPQNASRYRFSGADRSRILGAILRYYDVHLPGTSRLRTLPILRSLFS